MSYDGLYCRLPCNWLSDPSLCWFEWQTLISGIVAVFVGGISIHFLRQQISQSEQHERSRRSGNMSAARAMLRFAIVQACDHAQTMVEELDKVRVTVEAKGRSPSNPVKFPSSEPDPKMIDVFAKCIEWSEDKNLTLYLDQIISNIQILGSRVSTININPRSHVIAINDYVLQCGIIHALAIHVLPYARRDVGSVDPDLSWDSVSASLRHINVHEKYHPKVYAALNRRKDRGSRPVDFSVLNP